MCSGCYNNFYNGNNELGIKECWSFKSSKIVLRWRLGWWTRPDSKGVFQAVKTLSCHVATGQYAHFETLPAHLGGSKPTRKDVK